MTRSKDAKSSLLRWLHNVLRPADLKTFLRQSKPQVSISSTPDAFSIDEETEKQTQHKHHTPNDLQKTSASRVFQSSGHHQSRCVEALATNRCVNEQSCNGVDGRLRQEGQAVERTAASSSACLHAAAKKGNLRPRDIFSAP